MRGEANCSYKQTRTSWMRAKSWLKLFGSSSYKAQIWRMYLYWASYRLRSSGGNEFLPKHNCKPISN